MPNPRLLTSPYCTIGPFFPGTFVTGCEDMTSFRGIAARGQQILLKGRVFEEGARPIQNAVLEIWQPDANGIFRHPADPRFAEADPGFFGWGRVRTDANGEYCFRTILPGASFSGQPGLNNSGLMQKRCPHLNLMLLAIGLTRRLVTTVFFVETIDGILDPVLASVPNPEMRGRMLARREQTASDAEACPVYRYDIVTRGENESPFFVD